MKQPRETLTEFRPDGSSRSLPVTPEISAALEKAFIEQVDPETMELRSIQEARKRLKQKSARPTEERGGA